MARYKRGGYLADMAEAIERFQEVIVLCPPGHPDRLLSLSNLSAALVARYKLEGNSSILTKITEHCQEALVYFPPGHPPRAACLNNLSNALFYRYRREGSLLDLAEAIAQRQEALALCASDHPQRAVTLNNLSIALRERYEREENISDLAQAIEYDQEALVLCPPGHPERAFSLTNLANALIDRYLREGSPVDFEQAIEYHRQALVLRPPGHPDRAASLGSLFTTRMAQYEREGSMSDLEEAVEQCKEALALCPPGDSSRAISLNNLSTAVMVRYLCERSPSDLSDAAELYREGLELRPPSHPDRTQYLSSLFKSLLHAIDRATNTPGIAGYHTLVQEAFQVLHEAVNLFDCSPRHRLRAALQWISAAHRFAPESELDAYQAALEQFDIVLATNNTLQNKHNRLASSKDLAWCRELGVEAASCAVQQGRTSLAVELLERGRNLLFAQIARYRVDIEDLQKVNAELANRFSELSGLLDTSVASNQPIVDGKSAYEDPTERYRRVSSAWSQAVKEVRAVEGFDHFLRPPDYAALRAVAAEGPVIIIIPDDHKLDALIISQEVDTPHHVNLPGAGKHEMVELHSELLAAVQSDDEITTEESVKRLLRLLWELVVGPIAGALENELHIPLHSRIWWCPTSYLSGLPLHAAGRYASKDTKQNLPAKYVSSYTPTLQALLRARRNRSDRKGKTMMILAQPDTPGQSQLPNAQPEAELVKKLVEGRMKTSLISSKEGTHATILDGMANHSWLHLTCHGSQNFADPFLSCLCLYDGELTLSDIVRRGLPNADFAFLAACHTATGDNKLMDEGLHLAAGLQFSGFKSVVGTIWEVADDDGPVIAEAFYKALQDERRDEEGMDCRRAAYALSRAVRHLRDSGVPVNRWMRFIHIGI